LRHYPQTGDQLPADPQVSMCLVGWPRPTELGVVATEPNGGRSAAGCG
jgi:hypothetical protein